MDSYETLFRIAKLLLAEEDDETTPERLLERVVEQTGAERAFIVVRDEEGNYVQKLTIAYDPDALSSAERRFSRTLVREAIAGGEPIYLPSLNTDDRFPVSESTLLLGQCAVLLVPLRVDDEVYGVVYLENRRPESFDEESQAFAKEFAEVAGLIIRRALERQALRERNRSLERDLFAQHDFTGIIARHKKMLELLRVVAQVADADAPVLVRGETGTGKELIARALHQNSSRRHNPLVTVHCSALPEQLIDAELFGHVAGAFTDAKRDRVGRIASAHGGTLFLDEVGEIPPTVQAKLLRVLQFGEIQRVGSDQVKKVDVRLVTATHRDLKEMSRKGTFREDLYFRLKVLELHLPPLRERQSDIPILFDHFLKLHWRRPGETPTLSAVAARALQAYEFPGNVRELAHIVERACLLATGPRIDVDLLPEEMVGEALAESNVSSGVARFESLDREELNNARDAAVEAVEQQFLIRLMAQSDGNVSRAAREAGLHRSYLQKLLARHRDVLGDLTQGGV